MKSFYLEGKHTFTLQPYDKEKHAKSVRKFLYWNNAKGEQVLLASQEDLVHKLLLYYANRADDSNCLDCLEMCWPDGAGNANNGKVSKWFSHGFNVDTPDELKPIIKEALGLA